MTARHALSFGLLVGQREAWPRLVERAQETEALGFDRAWVVDHFFGGADEMDPTHEAYTILAGLAPVTERVRLGVMVCGNTYRNPVFLLKQAVAVDHISNGRVDFGIGAGWWEREHEAYGYDFPGKGELVGRFGEALDAIHSFQRNPRTTFEGKYYRYINTPFEPKAIQQPGLPIVVGASGPRMLAITARHANIWNTRSPLDEAVRKSRLLDEQCAAVGRDPADIQRSVWPFQSYLGSVDDFRAYVESFMAEGFTDFLFSWPRDDAEHGVLRQVAVDVIPALRAAQ